MLLAEKKLKVEAGGKYELCFLLVSDEIIYRTLV